MFVSPIKLIPADDAKGVKTCFSTLHGSAGAALTRFNPSYVQYWDASPVFFQITTFAEPQKGNIKFFAYHL